MCLERVKGTRVATSAQESYSWMQQGGKETRFPVTPPILQTVIFFPPPPPPMPARNQSLSSGEERSGFAREISIFFFFLWANDFFYIRRKERENSPIYPIFTRLTLRVYRERDRVLTRSTITWKSNFLSVTQDAHGESDACRRGETVGSHDREYRAKVHARVCTREYCILSFLLRDLRSSLGKMGISNICNRVTVCVHRVRDITR